MDFQNIQSKSDALKCPRCDSLHTKFCYYNNYNYSQPRHFCKSCRRYWTLGGLLRNVPVGGGIRKSKKNSKPKPAILTDPPSNSNSAVLSSDLEMLSTPLKLNQAGDWYDWIKNGKEFEAGIVAAAGDPAEEGFGSLDHLPTSGGTEGMVGMSGGVAGDGGSWFKFCGLTAPFNS